MNWKLLISSVIASSVVAPSAHAISSFELIASGSLTSSSAGSYADLSGLTGTLENGLPGNILGGVGSGLAYAGGNTFLALPDRGPNATAYNSSVDDTVSYISRFQTVNLNLVASPSGSLPYTLTPTLTATTLLSSPTSLDYGTGAGLGNKIDGTTPIGSGAPGLNAINNTNYFTGRSDNYGTGLSTNPNNGRLDPEGIRVSNDGKSVFVSDEYGPYVYQFDRATGQRIKTFTLPTNLAVPNLSPKGDTEIAGNTVGRVANKGMEGLAITPDGKTLVGMMQASLEQDTSGSVRIVTIDIATGTTHEYAYKLTTGSGVSEITAINDHQFLVDERDGKGLGDNSSASVKQLYQIDLNGAQDVSGMSGDLSSKAVSKTLFLDVKNALVNVGINIKDIPAKLEGLTFGQDIIDNGQLFHTLFVANDNDFLSLITDGNHPGGIANPNNFYVFAIAASDLPGFTAQAITPVPIPAAAWLMGSALIGLTGASRRRRAGV